jgi:hypothetical protein
MVRRGNELAGIGLLRMFFASPSIWRSSYPRAFPAMNETIETSLYNWKTIGVSLFTVIPLDNGNYRFVEGERDGEEITQEELDKLFDMLKRV